MNDSPTSTSFPNGAQCDRSEAEARKARGDAHVNAVIQPILDAFKPLSMLSVIQGGAKARRVQDLGCPFCGADAPMAAKVMGRFVIECLNDDCHASVSVAGSTLDEVWRKWNMRAVDDRIGGGGL